MDHLYLFEKYVKHHAPRVTTQLELTKHTHLVELLDKLVKVSRHLDTDAEKELLRENNLSKIYNYVEEFAVDQSLEEDVVTTKNPRIWGYYVAKIHKVKDSNVDLILSFEAEDRRRMLLATSQFYIVPVKYQMIVANLDDQNLISGMAANHKFDDDVIIWMAKNKKYDSLKSYIQGRKALSNWQEVRFFYDEDKVRAALEQYSISTEEILLPPKN